MKIRVLVLAVAALVLTGSRCTSQHEIAAYGDSITASLPWRSDWPHLIPPPLEAVDRGLDSEKTADGVARLLADLDAGQVPSSRFLYVSLFWGTNDLMAASWPSSAPAHCPADQCILQPLRTAASVAAISRGWCP